MKDFFKDSIYENVYRSQNWISYDWDKYKAKYSSGYSSSSYWLDIEDKEESSLKTKADLNYALVQVSKCVNLIRHKFGIGEKKALKVKWADQERLYNSSNDEYVYLSPSPLLSRSTLTLKQRYDVIVGQALLSSVQKHIIPARLYEFVARLESIKTLNSDVDLKMEIVVDYEKIFLKNNDSIFPYVPSYRRRKFKSNVFEEVNGCDHIDYPNRKTFYVYSNVTVGRIFEYHNIWRAIEQDITEKALSNEYKGSTSYLFAHRNFYLDKKYTSVLAEAVEYFDMEWLPKVWHLMIINNILNSKKITKMHPVYEKIQKIADETLIVNPTENSETRFASVIELIGKICDFMEELKFEQINASGSGIGENSDSEEEMSASLKKQLQKVTEDISNSGLGESLTKASKIISVKSHKNLVQNTREFDVSDQNSLRLFELENLSSGMTTVEVLHDNRRDSWAKQRYDYIANCNKKFIDYLKESMLIRSFDFFAEDYSMKSGIIDENSLWKLSLKQEDSENIFYQRCLPKTSDNVHITLVFDNSGSMANGNSSGNSRISICNNIAVVLNEVISTLPNVKLDVFSFSDYKFFSYQDNPYGTATQSCMGGTNEGLAVAKAIHSMESFRINNPEKFYGKRYLLAVGDGITNMEQTKKTNDFIRNNTDIKFFHIGIDNAYTTEFGNILYGEGNFAIIPSENLMQNLCTAIIKILS